MPPVLLRTRSSCLAIAVVPVCTLISKYSPNGVDRKLDVVRAVAGLFHYVRALKPTQDRKTWDMLFRDSLRIYTKVKDKSELNRHDVCRPP
jgi:hypothetical protein